MPPTHTHAHTRMLDACLPATAPSHQSHQDKSAGCCLVGTQLLTTAHTQAPPTSPALHPPPSGRVVTVKAPRILARHVRRPTTAVLAMWLKYAGAHSRNEARSACGRVVHAGCQLCWCAIVGGVGCGGMPRVHRLVARVRLQNCFDK